MQTPVMGAPMLSEKKPALIAPWWHTALLIGILVAASAGQSQTLGQTVARFGRLPLYISTMFLEWTLVGFIWMAIKRRGIAVRQLVGGKWSTVEDFLMDLAIAGGFWIVSAGVIAGVRVAMGNLSLHAADNAKQLEEVKRTIGFLAPHGTAETLLYICVTLTAGFCEELIFRGYLQKQFERWSGSVAVGILVQAALFGAAHGYQGVKMMIALAVFGGLFGMLAAWRKSLRPGMIAHTWQDLASGLLLRTILERAK